MYQPRRIDGQDVGTPARPAASRFDAIAKELDGHEGFTVLDLGAHEGYFSLRLAEEFNAQATAVDDWRGLKPALAGSPVKGVHERLTPEALEALGEFDVILCLSVLHHVPWWEQMLEQIQLQSKLLFVEVAVAHEDLPKAVAHCSEIPNAVAALDGRVIAKTHGYKSRKLRPMYVLGSLD
jgi:hypothetical protein